MRWRNVDPLLAVPLGAGALIVLHGLVDDATFRIDSVSIALVVIGILPFAYKFLTSVKAGDIELSFRSLSVDEQVLLFLDGVARQRMWTFYRPRPHESDLGRAFGLLVGNVLASDRRQFVQRMRDWLRGEDDHLRWFAAEVAGYYRIQDLKPELLALTTVGSDRPWEPWRLNCLWAYSRFDEYKRLHRFLLETSDSENQRWVIDAYDQMAVEEPEHVAAFVDALDSALAAGHLSAEAESDAKRVRAALSPGSSAPPGSVVPSPLAGRTEARA